MKIFSLLLLFFVTFTNAEHGKPKNMRFRDFFQFGVSTAAFQIEGAAKEDGVMSVAITASYLTELGCTLPPMDCFHMRKDFYRFKNTCPGDRIFIFEAEGKGESIWDRFSKDLDSVDGDVAADSYHHLKEDVAMLRQLGVDFYKFSISWSRVLPTGFPNRINEAGIKYYDDLLTLLEIYNIDAMVVMNHYDLPQPLQDLGGWANPESVKWFQDYADILLDKFNDKVKYWITINDPVTFCYDGYNGKTPPGVQSQGIGDYMCLKNMLISHGKVYRHFKEKYKKKGNNQMGFAMNLNTYIPKDHNWDNDKNKETVNSVHQTAYDIFLHPIYGKNGDFPMNVKKSVLKRSKQDNFTRSRLPSLSKEEIKMLKGASDFLGINHLTSFEVSKSSQPSDRFPDITAHITQNSNWRQSVSEEVKMYPYGLYYMWFILYKSYGSIDIFITEQGWPTGPGLEDQDRVFALKEYLNAMLFLLQDSGLSVKGFAVRSLMDGVEWLAGTSERYGLYEVDFASPNKTRSMRASAMFYRNVIESRQIDEFVYKNLDLDFSNRKTSKKTPAQVKEDMSRVKKIIDNSPKVMPTEDDDKTIKRLCNDEL